MTFRPTSSSGSGNASGAWTLITTSTRATDGTLDFTGIPVTYNDLVLVAIVRGTNAALTDVPKLVVNNDTAAHYDTQFLSGIAASATSGEAFGSSALAIGQIAAASATAGLFSLVQVYIPGYASATWQKDFSVTVCMKAVASTTGLQIVQYAGFWRSTAAVSRLTLSGNSTAALLTGSTGRLYGIT